MSTQPVPSLPLSRFEQLRYGREVLRSEALALTALADQLPLNEFCSAVELIYRCPGRVVVSGIGKAGLIARKIAATLCSTGTPSQFLHPAEAVHGDLGCIRGGDVALVLSFSGQTEEVLRLLPSLQQLRVPWIAITGQPRSAITESAAVVLDLGRIQEACPFGVAPSTSTTTMLAMGDALALVVSRLRGFGAEDFVRYHPGGSLGRKLTKVDEVMRPLGDCRIAHEQLTVRQAIVSQSRPGRRTGAIMLVNDAGDLTGIFTDSDLARLVGQKCDNELDQPIHHVMTKSPKVIASGEALEHALQILEKYKISELPVIEPTGRPMGLIDVTDLIGSNASHLHSVDQQSTAVKPSKSLTLPFPNNTQKMPRQ